MDIYFNGFKIKYTVLNSELHRIRSSRKVNTINIFINLDDLFHKMHKPFTENEFQCIGTNASRQVISNILNLVGHYKNWAYKERITPMVYITYCNADSFKNRIYVKEYRDYFIHINDQCNVQFFHLNQILADSYKMLHTIIKYVPDAYAINSQYLESSIVPMILSENNPADLNLLISRDEYDLQYSYMDKWAYMSPKGDNSYLIDSNNFWHNLRAKNKVTNDTNIHPEMFIYGKAVLGDKYRSIPKLARTGWKTILKYMQDVSNNNYTKEQLEIQKHYFMEYLTSKHVEYSDTSNNIAVTSVMHQYNNLLDTEKAMILSQLVDMQDMKEFNVMNEDLFKSYPINIPFIMRDTFSSFYGSNPRY